MFSLNLFASQAVMRKQLIILTFFRVSDIYLCDPNAVKTCSVFLRHSSNETPFLAVNDRLR